MELGAPNFANVGQRLTRDLFLNLSRELFYWIDTYAKMTLTIFPSTILYRWMQHANSTIIRYRSLFIPLDLNYFFKINYFFNFNF